MKKVAIITGGAKGIGAAIGYKLGTKGYAVVIADIDEKAGLYRLDHFTVIPPSITKLTPLIHEASSEAKKILKRLYLLEYLFF